MTADLLDLPPIPSDILPPIFFAVGELVLGWAFAEQNLDNMVTIFFHGAGAKTEAELPVALNRKMKYLRKCLRTVPALASFRANAEQLIDEAEKLSDTRHTVIHGAISEYNSQIQVITFVKLKAVKDRHWVDPRHMKLDHLLGIGVEAGKLGLRLGDLTRRLLDTFVPKDVRDKLGRDLGRQ